MSLSIHSSFLPQDDPDAAVGFYRDVVGWEVRMDVGHGGMRWITVGPAEQPGTSVVLFPPAATPGLTDGERRMVGEMMAKGTYAMLVLEAADVDAEFARLQAAGAEVMQEPIDQDYGTRDFAVRDPAGNMIRVRQA